MEEAYKIVPITYKGKMKAMKMDLHCVRAANTVPIKTCDKCIFYEGLVFGRGVKCAYGRKQGTRVTEEASKEHFLGPTIGDFILEIDSE